jgi:RimJ/RimL family protein N-acetyltransferase
MFARTDRLLLRPGWAEDAPALAEAIADEAIVTKLARVPWPYRVEDAEAYLRDSANSPLPRLLMFLRTRGAPKLIGGIGLEPTATGAELGYWVARAYWGLGFATEAGRAVVQMAEALRLKLLEAGPFPDNPASTKVLRKLGFQPTDRVSGRYNAARNALLPCLRFERRHPLLATPQAIAA